MKEKLKLVYNELDEINITSPKQFVYSTQILSKMNQAIYYIDQLLNQLKNENRGKDNQEQKNPF